MQSDPYTTLGIKRDATAAQIKSAYLKLAKKHHPDLNPGDAAAEERFKAISAAHDLLSDVEKRLRFDRGEIDGTGQERPPPRPQPGRGYRAYADGAEGARYRASGMNGTQGGPDLHDIFADLFRGGQPGGQAAFGAGMGGQQRAQTMRGADQRYQISVTFIEAALGASRRLDLPDGRTLDVSIPAGLEDGQTLRLRGQGDAGWNGGPPGDALIEVDLTVTAGEAALGAKVAVPTPAGPVSLSIPKHSDTGKQLRLRGRGIPAHAGQDAGDLYITLKIMLGTPDAALEAALKAFYEAHKIDPRAHMGEAT
jgi:DnaJ-class molecular chaperone